MFSRNSPTTALYSQSPLFAMFACVFCLYPRLPIYSTFTSLIIDFGQIVTQQFINMIKMML